MTESQRSVATVCYQFGPFEFEPESGELRRHDARIRLSRQRQTILTMLLERAGELVKREEIQARLWGPDTFVDYDNSVNTAVNRIRQALRDSAEQPLYIETQPGLGYRFIAPVKNLAVSEPLPESETDAAGPLPLGSEVDIVIRPSPGSRLKIGLALAGGALLSVLIFGLALLASRRAPRVISMRQITFDHNLKSWPGNLQLPLSDGKRVYFNDYTPQGWQLMATSLDNAENITRIGSVIPELRLNALSPDGLRLLATQPADLGAKLWVVTLPDGALHAFEHVQARAACWSPHGRRIAFSWQRRLMLMHADGGGRCVSMRMRPPDAKIKELFPPFWAD